MKKQSQRGHSAKKGLSRDSQPGPADSLPQLVPLYTSQDFTHSAALHTQRTVGHKAMRYNGSPPGTQKLSSSRASEKALAWKGKGLLKMKTNLTS